MDGPQGLPQIRPPLPFFLAPMNYSHLLAFPRPPSGTGEMASPTYHCLPLFLLCASLLPSLLNSAELLDSSPPTGSYKHMAREFLDSHNLIRRYVGEAPYAWNQTLARYARRWAAQRRGDCECIHSDGPYGENMFWGSGQDWRAADAVENWAREHYDYDEENNTCRDGRMCGHYTQIVWNATTMVGCGRVHCYGGGVIMVCNYDPPGNYVGESPFQDIIT